MATVSLPDVEFAERDATTIESAIITGFEAVSGDTLYPGDPRRLFLEAVAAIIIQQRSVIDFSAKMNLLSYAVGDYLDVLGELVLGPENGRLAPQPALTTIRFTLSAPQASVYTIPTGTEIAGGNLIFATTETIDIPIGELVGEARAAAVVPGVEGNGLLPGQIKTPVLPLPFMASAVNITPSTAGADREDDENLRDRIRLAPASFSVAGPRDAYKFWARTANQAIIDVSVIGPPAEAGRVYVRPLLVAGEIPTQDVLDQVYGVLSEDTVRPLTDEVIVVAPTAVDYAIDFDYWISAENVTQSATIQTRVVSAVETYRLWQRGAIGRDINPDELVRLVKQAGAKRVVLRMPAFVVLDDTQVAQETGVTASYQGIEDA